MKNIRRNILLTQVIVPMLALVAIGAPPHPTVHEPGPVSGVCSPGSDWWQQASRAIASMEYDATPTPDGLQAPNRAHGLRSQFLPGGVAVGPRHAEAGAWKWSWTTRAFGRVGAMRSIAVSVPAAERATVRYARDSFVEWYENSPAGVEQGFTLASPPPSGGEVCIAGTIGHGLAARQDGGSIRFADARGKDILVYGKLATCDATGKRLPSRLALDGQEIRILVDDRGATYPITIDPLLESPSWQVEGDCEGAYLGRCASTVGDVNGDGYSDILISATSYDLPDTNCGKVWAFYGSAEGLHSEPDWSASGDQAFASFGGDVSAAGDVNGDGFQDVMIGSTGRVNENGTKGRVYVYLGSSSGLSTPAWTQDCDLAVNTMFGGYLGTAGDVNGDGFDDVIISAYIYPGEPSRRGRAWLYLGSASGLGHTPAWTADGVVDLSYFGACCGTAGDVNGDGYDDFILSAMREGPGRAYLYLGSPLPLSTVPAWTADGDGPGSYFGQSISAAGDVDGDGYADVLVGELYSNPELEEGRVVLFRGCADGLEDTPAWSAEGDNPQCSFGEEVGTAGDVNGDGLSDVCIGARSYMLPDSSRVGRAFVYYGSRSGLPAEPTWFVDGEQVDGLFGNALTTAGDVNGDGFSDLLVTEVRYSGAFEHCGRASVYYGSGDMPRKTAGWAVDSNQSGAYFGFAVASAGDVNGDGFDDMLVGAPSYDNGQSNEGAAFLFLGHGAGPSVLPDWWAESNQAAADFGIAVAGAGDVNGDGYDDVLVGAPSYDVTLSNEGAAFLWYGTPGGAPMGTPANAAWSCAGGVANAGCGYSIACAGDTDANGYADVIVGMPGYTNGQSMEGKAALYRGSAAGLSTTASWSYEGNQANALAGFDVTGVGDMNADGYCDAAVGAPYYDGTYADEGITWIFHGYSGGLRTTAGWQTLAHVDGAHLGWSIAGAGDVNGDACGDIVIGAPDARWGLPEVPGIIIIYGSQTGTYSLHTILGSGGQFGYSVASAGDFDGDGYSDIIVGTTHSTNPETDDPDCGHLNFLRGSPTGAITTSLRIYGSQSGAFFGGSVASADVNGDGFSDILAGAHLFTLGQTEEGRALVFYGNDSRGLPRAPDQLRADLTAPIALRGLAHSSHSVALRALGRMAGGRGKVRMEWQIEPTGDSFDGARIQKGTVHDTGAPVANVGSATSITENYDLLVPATEHHWRLRIASRSPYFPRTPWFSPSGNGMTETDLRAEGSPADAAAAGATPDLLRIAARPNPFSTGTRVEFNLPDAGTARINVYDVQGRRVRTIHDGVMAAGSHEVSWDGTDDAGRRLASGVYWITLTSAGRESHQQVVFMEESR
jgi:hypothetical protein